MTLTFPARTCQDCTRILTFSTDDREFFQVSGYTEPQQCRPCRAARKAEHGSGVGDSPRQARPGACAECGETSETEFHLWGHPSAYCRDCLDKKSAKPSRYETSVLTRHEEPSHPARAGQGPKIA